MAVVSMWALFGTGDFLMINRHKNDDRAKATHLDGLVMGRMAPYLFALLVTLLTSTISVSEDIQGDSDWLIAEADRISCQAHYGEKRFIKAQDSAIVIAQKALKLVSGESDHQYSCKDRTILCRLGDYYYLKGDFAAADSFWVKATSGGALDNTLSIDEFDGSRFRLSILHYSTGNPSSETPEVEGALRFRSLVEVAQDSLSVRRLYQLGIIYDKLGMSDSIVPYLERSVQAYQRHPIGTAKWAIHAYIVLAEGYSKKIRTNVSNSSLNQDSAIALGKSALSIAEAAFGTTDTLTAWVLQRLGDYHNRRGNYVLVDSLWQRAWYINSQNLPPESIELQGNMSRMAGVYESRGDFAAAENLRLQAVSLRAKTQGPGHPETAAMYMNLASFYRRVGKFALSEKYCQRALRIRENAMEQVPSDRAACMRLLGQLAADQGRFASAEGKFMEALRIETNSLGDHHANTARCMSDLANLYLEWNRIEEAAQMFRRSLTVKESFEGPDHPDLVGNLESLAQIDLGQRRLDSAQGLLERALTIVEQSSGKGGSRYARLLALLGDVQHAGKLDLEANRTYRLAIEVQKQAPDGHTLELISMMDKLARFQLDLGRIDTARTTFAAIDSLVRGDTLTMSPDVAGILEDYAAFCLLDGRTDKARELSRRCYSIRLANCRDGLPVLSEPDALRYCQFLHRARDLYLECYLAPGDHAGSDLEEALKVVLTTKGVVGDEVYLRNRRIANADSSTLRVADSLHYCRTLLSRLYVGALSDAAEGGATRQIQTVTRRRDVLETRLARMTYVSGEDHALSEIDPDTIVQALPAGSALVEYVRLRPPSVGSRQIVPVYVAVVVTSSGETAIRTLGSAAPIDSAVARYREHFEDLVATKRVPDNQDMETYYQLAGKITSLVVSPIADMIDRSRTIVIAPDGALNLVSFAGLCDTSHQYLIERHRIHYVSAGRDLIRYDKPIASNQKLVAFGDPDFDAGPSELRQISAQVAAVDSETASYSSLRDVTDECFDMSHRQVSRLPGTRREVERACRLWDQEPGFSSTAVEGSYASESSLKAMAGSAQVLHIATHGFYFSKTCQTVQGGASDRMNSSGRASPIPLSGLLLAGANRETSGGPGLSGSDDGILTSEEVSSLDLVGTSWVVLSACESGMGALQDGEGVYGLRRAFQMGGARTVICALWPVADQAAAIDMGSLYESRFADLPDIMQNICLKQLSDMRRRGQPEHPYLWAPFIAVGDWRGLSRN